LTPLAVEAFRAGKEGACPVAEYAEVKWGTRQSPGRVQSPLGGKTAQPNSVEIEDVDESVSRPGDVVVLQRVLLRERDDELAADVANTERRKTGGNVGVRSSS